MKQHILAAVLLAAITSSAAWADGAPLDLTYTVMGTGGLSEPQAGVSDSRFWWIDSSGTIPASTVAATGFVPFPVFEKFVDGFGFGGGGSLLASSTFTLGDDELLAVNFSILTGIYSWSPLDYRTAPGAFVLLLQADQPPVVLANTTANLSNRFAVDLLINPNSPYFVHPTDGTFASVSPGVTATALPVMPVNEPPNSDGLDVTLGYLHYWDNPNLGGDCGCALEVASTYMPGAGTYQLLFGMYNYSGIGTYPGRTEQNVYIDGALAVTDVSVREVPESSSLVLLTFGLLGMGLLWRRHQKAI